jgi:hypothetical protein
MKNEIHVMVDLETWGTAPGCAIRSIGAVEFCPVTGKLGDEFYATITDASCTEAGLKRESGTAAWWAKPENAKANKQLLDDQMPLRDALTRFKRFWGDCEGDFFWSQGANFDEPILGWAMRAVAIRPPWKFAHARDTRTAYHMGMSFGKNYDPYSIKRAGTYHNALDDAKHQARCVHLSVNSMFGGKLV